MNFGRKAKLFSRPGRMLYPYPSMKIRLFYYPTVEMFSLTLFLFINFDIYISWLKTDQIITSLLKLLQCCLGCILKVIVMLKDERLILRLHAF